MPACLGACVCACVHSWERERERERAVECFDPIMGPYELSLNLNCQTTPVNEGVHDCLSKHPLDLDWWRDSNTPSSSSDSLWYSLSGHWGHDGNESLGSRWQLGICPSADSCKVVTLQCHWLIGVSRQLCIVATDIDEYELLPQTCMVVSKNQRSWVRAPLGQ